MQVCLLSLHGCDFGCVSELLFSEHPAIIENSIKTSKHKPDVQVRLWSKELLWFTESKGGSSHLQSVETVDESETGTRVSSVRAAMPRNDCGVRSGGEKLAERSQQGVAE